MMDEKYFLDINHVQKYMLNVIGSDNGNSLNLYRKAAYEVDRASVDALNKTLFSKDCSIFR